MVIQMTANRRKVALWSREKWRNVDSVGDAGLPPRRFVSGISHGIQFIGVCIPWRDAHVRTGDRNRAPWEDHISYLKRLRSIVQKKSLAPLPLVVLGDFNQRIPRNGQPPEIARMLAEVVGDSMCIHTSGIKDDAGRPLIDHVAASPSMGVHVERFLPKAAENGLHLTDHSGIVAVIHERS